MSTRFARYKYVNTTPKRILVRRVFWELVWLVAFRPTPRWALYGWRCFLLRLFGARIGVGCRIAPSCFIWAPWNLELGDYVALGDQVDCYAMDKIRIGSKTAVSQRTFLCAGTHEISSLRRPLSTAPISIGEHCWLCAESMVLPGRVIGDGTVVGARSLVTHDLPAWMVCAGNPCRPVRPREVKDR